MPGATSSSANGSRAGGVRASRGELIAKAGTIVSAIMASSCCWLPVLLLAVGVSGAGIATALEAYRPIFMVVTFGFLAMAFYFTYRPRPAAAVVADCCAPQAVTIESGALQTPQSGCCAPATAQLTSATAATVGKRRFSMMAFNKGMLWVVTVLAVVFLFFPQYVTGLFVGGNDEIGRDMTRTELIIGGMTCEG